MRISHHNPIKPLKEVILPKHFNILDAIEETREDVHNEDEFSVWTWGMKLLFKPIELPPGFPWVLSISHMEINGVEANNWNFIILIQ
jgi:hypothetical protein